MMEITKVKIGKVKTNPDNPRLIKDDKFKKLVESIKKFPQMLEIRPIVVDSDFVVLGGNMRLKACKDAGLKDVFIIKADDLTEDQKREFIVKDNVGFGEWDWEMLGEWDMEELEDWGLDIIGVAVDEDECSDEFSLPDGDKEPFQQMTFTLADEQAVEVKQLLDNAKQRPELNLIETYGNENSNGNALYALLTGQL